MWLTALSSFGESRNTLLQARLEEERRASIIQSILGLPHGSSSNALIVLELVGQARLPGPQNRTQTCVVLSTTNDRSSNRDDGKGNNNSHEARPCLLLPLEHGSSQLKLLEFAKFNQPLSKTTLLQLNAGIYNRDQALFDNLPWATWTVDPQLRNRDAAGNPILPRYHLGKRDAYNRLLGKDWQGQSVAMANLALRLKYAMMESSSVSSVKTNEEVNLGDNVAETDFPGDDDDLSSSSSMEDGTDVLMRRILELQVREQEMQIADLDYQIAVAKQQQKLPNDEPFSLMETPDEAILLAERAKRLQALSETKERLRSLLEPSSLSAVNSQEQTGIRLAKAQNTWFTELLDEIADQYTNNNAPPYRGATGYAPMPDRYNDVENPPTYASPFDLLKEIFQDQLKAEVIGAVLENASLLEGTLALGGAIVLRRMTTTKTMTLAGESLTVNDDEQDFGNQGVTGGATILVECDPDEAIGMAMACSVPLRIEADIWNRASVMCKRDPQAAKEQTSASGATTVKSALPFWTTADPELSVLFEGLAGNRSSTERTLPLRIPRTTMSLLDRLFEDRPSGQPLFPTDNPIQSLSDLDALTNQDKARTLLQMSNFEGKLPRPRVVRQNPNALDELLVPLIDESVRRQYLIRDAERRGDMERVKELESVKSKRQMAKEQAEEARLVGAEDLARKWDEEAELYSSLRADVTQDEGSYSRFL